MDRFKFPGWASVHETITMMASAIAAGKGCPCQSGKLPCSDCKLSAAMASIANLIWICKETQERIDELRDPDADRRERKPAPSRAPTARVDCAETEARSFREWIRRAGIKHATAPDLSKLYARYMDETLAPAVPDAVLRNHLLKLDGVSKQQNDEVDQSTGRRWRPTVWKFANINGGGQP